MNYLQHSSERFFGNPAKRVLQSSHAGLWWRAMAPLFPSLQVLTSVHPEMHLRFVILRSEATKNPEILRCPEDDKMPHSLRSLS